jgi:hypothetical protein
MKQILTMKQYLRLIAMTLCVALLASCGGGSDNNNEPSPTPPSPTPPNTYRQTVEIGAEAVTKIVSLTNLNAAINNISKSVSWIEVAKRDYTSGNPSIAIIVSENTTGTERQTDVNITDVKGNTVILTVKQVKKGSVPQPDTPAEDGIEDPHNIVTDKPEFSRESGNNVTE